MTRRIIGPFNRVEGDLEVTLDISNGHVDNAYVNASLYRGFEHILKGRPAFDALSITPRICGICSVSQSMATARALSDALGINPEPNGQLAANLVHATENLSDHLTHFYLFFMPDFTRKAYERQDWFGAMETRFAPNGGASAKAWLKARARLLHITGILAGKWPHSLAIQPGGLTLSPNEAALIRLQSVLADIRDFMEHALFGQPIEAIATMASRADWAQALDTALTSDADLALFGRAAAALDLENLGQGYDRFMSFGAYHGPHGALFEDGLIAHGKRTALDPKAFSEDPTHAWLMGDIAHPADGETLPYIDRDGAYSWCKAPRVSGHPVEVGAVARQLIAGQPLITTLLGDGPANVFARIVARLVESARILLAMESWVRALKPNAPVCTPLDGTPLDGTLQDGVGSGLVEAARGSLGHWIRIENGQIQHYQIIAPTTWNFSPRDSDGVPGPLEYALQGTSVDENDANAVAVQHIVRSFDPCMVCTVH